MFSYLYYIDKLRIAAIYEDIKSFVQRYLKAKSDIKKEDLGVL
jgi:hypothetical protein